MDFVDLCLKHSDYPRLYEYILEIKYTDEDKAIILLELLFEKKYFKSINQMLNIYFKRNQLDKIIECLNRVEEMFKDLYYPDLIYDKIYESIIYAIDECEINEDFISVFIKLSKTFSVQEVHKIGYMLGNKNQSLAKAYISSVANLTLNKDIEEKFLYF